MSDIFVEDGGDPVDEGVIELDALDAEGLVQRVLATVLTAKSMPLSSSILISREEVSDILQRALDRLPDEIREARWLLKEREDFMAEKRREAEMLLEDVRAQAERMVSRTEVVRQANHTAQRIVDEASEEARRLRHEAEDYCDQKLAAFEIVLDRTLKTVQAGREKLQVTPLAMDDRPDADGIADAPSGAADQGAPGDGGFFDQDDG